MSYYIPMLTNKLESLPSELILEIFDYLSVNDLIRAFYNLNTRLNYILFSSNIHLHILYPDDIHNSAVNHRVLLNFIMRQRFIARFRLSHDGQLSEHNLVSFSHIRSLILDTPTSTHVQMILPEIFPRLEYLRIGYSSANAQLIKLHQYIFSNAFPSLQKCSLNNVNENKPWTGSPSIRSLSIWSDSPRSVVERVLYASMYLISFHLFLNWPSTCSILEDKITQQHMNLKFLKLHLNGQWTLQKLDSFLTYIPTIKFLELYSSYFDSKMIYFHWNFKEMGYIFSCRLPSLSYFDCELIFKKRESIDLQEIHSFHSCFNRIQYETFTENESLIRIFTNK